MINVNLINKIATINSSKLKKKVLIFLLLQKYHLRVHVDMMQNFSDLNVHQKFLEALLKNQIIKIYINIMKT